MKLGGNLPPGHDALLDKWHGIFYMPSRKDTVGHTKVFHNTRSHRYVILKINIFVEKIGEINEWPQGNK